MRLSCLSILVTPILLALCFKKAGNSSLPVITYPSCVHFVFLDGLLKLSVSCTCRRVRKFAQEIHSQSSHSLYFQSSSCLTPCVCWFWYALLLSRSCISVFGLATHTKQTCRPIRYSPGHCFEKPWTSRTGDSWAQNQSADDLHLWPGISDNRLSWLKREERMVEIDCDNQ